MNPAHPLLLAGAAAAGATVFLLSQRLALPGSRAPIRALARHLERSPAPVPDDRVRTQEAFLASSLGLPPRPGFLVGLRLAATLLPALALLLLGYPLVPALGGGALVGVLFHHWLAGRWHRFRLALEQELPTFVSRLAATLLVTGAPLPALEEVLATLPQDSPLRAWLLPVLARLHTQGPQALEQAREEALLLSPSLALLLFQLGRFFQTGGAGFVQAFATTADQLAAILEARALASAKAHAARSAVHMMLAILGAILLLMLAAPAQRPGFAHPLAQLVSALALLTMALGYLLLDRLIREATS